MKSFKQRRPLPPCWPRPAPSRSWSRYADGAPYTTVTDLLEPAANGAILYLEPLESSAANRNLVRSIWFDRPVSIAPGALDGRRFHIRGRVRRTHIAGPFFQERYVALRERRGDLDLAAVWEIVPTAVEDQDFDRLKAEEARHPFFRHLDRIARA